MKRAAITFATNQGEIGGGEVMLLNLATAAREIGLEVGVVAPSESQIQHQCLESGITVHQLGSTRRGYLVALSRWSRTHRGLLWANGLAPALATSGVRRRVVHLHQAPQPKHLHAARVARLGARVTVVPSETTAAAVPGAKVLENWTSEVAVEGGRVRSTPPVIGFLGRPSVDKGVVVLAEAMQILAGRMPAPPRLMLAGEPRFVSADEQSRVDEALSSVSQLVDRVGWISPQRFFESVDLAVFPSVWPEPFGLVVAEAMSARVPFVVSTAGALSHVAGPTHPWIAPHSDALALANTIEAALNSSPDATATALATARERWETQYSPAAGQARLAQLLEDLNLI